MRRQEIHKSQLKYCLNTVIMLGADKRGVKLVRSDGMEGLHMKYV